jgi:hypothetical protein
MKKIFLFLLAAFVLIRCSERDSINPASKQAGTGVETALSVTLSANTLYVSTSGSDANNGSMGSPFRTIGYAVSKVPSGQGATIQVAAGTYVENGRILVPPGVSIVGAGMSQTIIKAASSFYYHPSDPGYATDRFLVSLDGSSQTNGNQQLSGFTIDGDSKQLHAGIFVKYRDNVIISDVKVTNTNFTGIWLWDVRDSQITKSQLVNCSWGSSSYVSGALNLGNVTRLDVDQLSVDENTGYGIKAIGPSGNNNIISTKIHDSHISVTPHGLWNGGSAPNIAIELWSVNLVGNEIYNTYVDNTISLINANALPSTGTQTIRVHNNTIDMDTRAHGAGYGIELTIHDAEIDHNYFVKGSQGIANWDHPMSNWYIHHNTFYALQGTYPGEAVRSQKNGLHNVKFYNNTVEFASSATMNVIGMYGGASDNVDMKNNLLIDNNSGYNYYPNQLVHLENGATLSSLTVQNNAFQRLPVGSVPGNYSGNMTSDPQIAASGNRPDAYYNLKATSPLINAGVNVGYSFSGSAPDIGAFEYSAPVANALPTVSLTSPATGATVSAGMAVTISANAFDNDGTVSKVEFFNGVTKIGEDLSSPYSMVWNATTGTAVITAKATDNAGGVATSIAATFTVGGATTSPAGFRLGLDSNNATLGGKMTTGYDGSAQNGNFFYVAPGNGVNYYIPPTSAATFNFQVPTTGNYVVWAKVKTATSGDQAFAMYNGAGKWFTWNAGIHTSWTWVKISDGSADAQFPFNAGNNSFKMGWRDDNAQVDQVVVTNDMSYTPQ